jgi:predicted O-methyltransferase YrrM
LNHPLKLAELAVRDHGAIQKPAELAGFLALVMDLDPLDLIVEVGSFDGGTLWAWQQVCPQVVGVDLPPPGHEDTVRLNSLGCPIVCGDSHVPSTVERLKGLLDRPVDMLFIDGDHTYDGVSADYDMYSPLVRPGGLIGFHDICQHPSMEFVQVNRFWATLDGDLETFISEPPTWGGIGVIRVPDDPDAAARRRADRDAAYQQAQHAAYGQPRTKVTTG